MLETESPVEVIAALRIAERLLVEEAERRRGQSAPLAGYEEWGLSARYRELLEAAAELGRLADLIATEAERG